MPSSWTSDADLATYLDEAGLDVEIEVRDVLWSWARSQVERVVLLGGKTVVLKCAYFPFDLEDDILRHLGKQGVPVPEVLYSSRLAGMLTMLLEDLGSQVRQPTLTEAAAAAVAIHSARAPRELERCDTSTLRALPFRIEADAGVLDREGMWKDIAELREVVRALVPLTDRLSAPEMLDPWGLCHSEFHPTSLHVGSHRFGIIDVARAFRGPQLIDLASYAGTQQAPDPTACRALIDAYLMAGGDARARDNRAGVPAENWALFWHRVWVASIFIADALQWASATEELVPYQRAITRHLRDALELVS